MKKLVCLMLCVMMLMAAVNAFAANYATRMDNETTFETLEEARVNGPVYLSEALGMKFVADPCLDTYPVGTTYVYRSAGTFNANLASVRMNTNFLVYVDQKFEAKEDALAYIQSLGLDTLVEEAGGSIVLVTPIGAAFDQNDQYAFFQLQTAMCNINNMAAAAFGGVTLYADNSYYGGLTFRYVIGIDGGATFVNNFIASTYDYVTRIAGMLLVGGDMERIRDVASFVPVYLVNPSAMAVEKYKAANEVNAQAYDGSDVAYFNQQQPLQKVVVSDETELTAELVAHAYYSFLIKAERNAVVRAGLNNASMLYANYNFNQAPYSLNRRVALFDGEAYGLVITEHCDAETFQDIARADNGEHIDEWWEILPEEVLDGSAGEHTIPLVVLCHGNGDDSIQMADEAGWLTVAADHRVAVVSPCHQFIGNFMDYSLRYDAIPAMAQYMLDQYPALDPSRVYVSGYSMGGNTTFVAMYGNPELFAGCVPMAAMPGSNTDPNAEQAAILAEIDMPTLILSSTADMAIDDQDHFIASYIGLMNTIMDYNEMDKLGDPDYDAYWMLGFKADHFQQILLNNEYNNYTWLFDKDGVPMAGVTITDFLPHGLYPEYGNVAWDFLNHYSRDPETKEIIYTPYER